MLLLFFTLLQLMARFALLRAKGKPTLQQRAEWMHRSCSLVIKRLGLTLACEGPQPQAGLIVSNHLGYLDILLHAAAGPRVFVSKKDVRSWPMFGLLAACGGTLFIERGNRASASEIAMRVEYALRAGVTVVLFPEGTSTDGTTLLPFHSFLFEPAVEAELPVTASAIRYEADGVEERDLCYYGDVQFASHLFETVGREEVRGRIRFDAHPQVYSNRKYAATDTWERIARLRLRAVMDDHAEQAVSLAR